MVIYNKKYQVNRIENCELCTKIEKMTKNGLQIENQCYNVIILKHFRNLLFRNSENQCQF